MSDASDKAEWLRNDRADASVTSSETNILLMKAEMATRRQAFEALERRVAAMESDRSRLLLWGVMTLGGMVLALVAWIVSFAKVAIK